MDDESPDVRRLRENLARALRYAEASRGQANLAEHHARKMLRDAARLRVSMWISASLTLLGFVMMLMWGLTR